MKKNYLIPVLFVATISFGYYYALSTNFGDSALSGIKNITLVLELTAIFFFLFISSIISAANIRSNSFSFKALIWPFIALILAIYFWIDNGHVSTFSTNPGNYSEFTLVFLPSILFVIISLLLSYSNFQKHKETRNPKPF